MIIGSEEVPIQSSLCARGIGITLCRGKRQFSHSSGGSHHHWGGTDRKKTWDPSSLRGERSCGDRMDWWLARYGWRGQRACSDCCIYERTTKTTINRVDRWHLIFDSNSTTYVEKYVISTKWLKLAPWIKLYLSLPTCAYIYNTHHMS